MCFYKMKMNLSRFRPPLFSDIFYEYVSWLYIFTFIEKNTELNKAVKNITNKCTNIERFLE